MSTYMIPIETAIVLFPILAAIITIPYVIHQYRKYGSILFLRVTIVYSFVFYLLCAYFIVNLPLPPIDEVSQYTNPSTQLIPFKSLMELSVATSFIWNDPSTYIRAFNEPNLYLIVFNILLTIPFGIYLRYYFECSLKKTLFYSFLLTLSFECIQLSSLFGIYPRPYRIFDVDDLITNTLGGMIGYAITPAFSHFLATRDKLDEESFAKGQQVSSLRRVFAFFGDVIIVLGLSFILYKGYTYFYPHISFETMSLDIFISYICCCSIYFLCIPIFTKGKTLGKMLVKIKLVRVDEKQPKWYQYIGHFFILYLIVLPAPYVIFCFMVELFTSEYALEYLFIISCICLFIFYVISLIQGIATLFVKDYFPWYARLAKLKNCSTILVKESTIKEDDLEESTIMDTSLVSPLETTVEEPFDNKKEIDDEKQVIETLQKEKSFPN